MLEVIGSMSFREKSVWISTAIMVWLWSWYASAVIPGIADGSITRAETVGLFVGMTVAVVVMEVIAHIILAIFSPRDANSGADERDRMINRRAESHSAWMLGGGIITICMFTMFQDLTAVSVVHLLLLLLIAVEIATGALEILYYRRGM